jgi:hypothetical protein
MSKRVSCTPTVFVGVLAAAIMLGANCAALAADDCLAAPNRSPAPGGHWYYHPDRASDRKCWYLVEPAGPAPVAQPSVAQAPPEPNPPPAQPLFGSFFSSLSAGFTPTPNTTGDARVAQPASADDLKTGAAPEPGRPPHMALAAKQHRSVRLQEKGSPVRPPAEHAEARPAASLDQAERDALFEEYLKWRERQ